MPETVVNLRTTCGSLLLALTVASGLAFGANPLSPIETAPREPLSITSAGGNESGLIVSLHSWSEGRSLAYRRFAADGSPLGPPIAFALGGSDLGQGVVAWNGLEWLIAWHDSSGTHLTRVGAGGELIATEKVVGEGAPIALAGTTGRWLLVSSGNPRAKATMFDGTARNVVAARFLTEIAGPRVSASAGPEGFAIVGQNLAGDRLTSERLAFDGQRLGSTLITTTQFGPGPARLVRYGPGFTALWIDLTGALQGARLDEAAARTGEIFRLLGDASIDDFDAARSGDRVVIAATATSGARVRVSSVPAGVGDIISHSLSDEGIQPRVAALSARTIVTWLRDERIEGQSLAANLLGPSIGPALSDYATEQYSVAAAGDEFRIAVWIERTQLGWRARGVRIVRGLAVDIVPLDFGPAASGGAVIGVGAIDRDFLVVWQGPEETLYRRLTADFYEAGITPLELYPVDDLLITTNETDFVLFGVTRPVDNPLGARELFTQIIPRNENASIPTPSTHWSGANPEVTRVQVARSGGQFLTVWSELQGCVLVCEERRSIWGQYVNLDGSATTNAFPLSVHPLASAPVVTGFQEFFFVAWREENIVGTILETRAGRVFPPPVVLREPIGAEKPEAALWVGFEIILATNRRILTTGFSLQPGSIRATPSTLEDTQAWLTFGGDSTPDIVLLDRLPVGPHGGAIRTFAESLEVTPIADIQTTIRPSSFPSGSIRHEIVVRNLGPGIATGVRLDAELGAGMALETEDADCIGGRCLLRMNLAPSAEWVIHLSSGVGPAVIAVDAAAAQRDLVPSNNRAEEEIHFTPSRRRAVSRP